MSNSEQNVWKYVIKSQTKSKIRTIIKELQPNIELSLTKLLHATPEVKPFFYRSDQEMINKIRKSMLEAASYDLNSEDGDKAIEQLTEAYMEMLVPYIKEMMMKKATK